MELVKISNGKGREEGIRVRTEIPFINAFFESSARFGKKMKSPYVYFAEIYICLTFLREKLEDNRTERFKTNKNKFTIYMCYREGIEKEKLNSLYTKLYRSECTLRTIHLRLISQGQNSRNVFNNRGSR